MLKWQRIVVGSVAAAVVAAATVVAAVGAAVADNCCYVPADVAAVVHTFNERNYIMPSALLIVDSYSEMHCNDTGGIIKKHHRLTRFLLASA